MYIYMNQKNLTKYKFKLDEWRQGAKGIESISKISMSQLEEVL